MVNRDGPAYVLENLVGSRNHWIMFRVVDRHDRDAIGARVAITVDGRTYMRDVRTAYSYCASNDPRAHVGLGQASTARNVTVRWVDGTIETFGDFAAGSVVTLIRGSGN